MLNHLFSAMLWLQETPTAPAPASDGANTTVKIVAGVLAVVLLAIVVLRRKGKKKAEDEF